MAPTLVVVGAGPGLGASVARRFGRDGFDVALVARRAAPLEALGAELQAVGVTAGWSTADVADPDSLTAALEGFLAHTGRVDVLLHNVSTSRPATATQTSAEDLLADLAVGTGSLLTAVRAVLPSMRAAGRGTILATGSGTCDRPMVEAASLGVQKAAQRNLVVALDAELRPRGIRVGTLVVRGVMKPGTRFDHALVADAVRRLAHRADEPAEAWDAVVDFTGGTP